MNLTMGLGFATSTGIIYSDIGTSPLYVLNGIWPPNGPVPSEEDVIGGLRRHRLVAHPPAVDQIRALFLIPVHDNLLHAYLGLHLSSIRNERR